MQLLVNTKDFDVDAQDGLGWTPLMMAVSVKDSDNVVDLLLSRGASVGMTSAFFVDPQIGKGPTPQSVIRWLTRAWGADNNGQTALHFTASKSALDTARKLIAAKATTRTKDKRGQLPLHRAAAVGSVPMIRLLLDNRSPVNATDVDGMTALHHAISEGHGDAALELLKAGAETDKTNVDGMLAIAMAPDTKVR